jgi:ABC-type uncharacterized transport system ATPase subunit
LAEAVDPRLFEAIPGVSKVTPSGKNKWQLSATEDVRERIFRKAVEQQWTLLELHQQEHSVEDIFQLLTKAQR